MSKKNSAMYLLKTNSKKAGLPPGTLLSTESETAGKITYICYDETTFKEKNLIPIKDELPLQKGGVVNWIHFEGISQAAIYEQIAKQFGVHRLVLEDIGTPGQRPKIEEYENYAFIILRSLSCTERNDLTIEDEQISLLLFDNIVISFQEKSTHLFESVKERIRSSRGMIRKMGSDYLAYALVDLVVDNYFIMLEKIGDILGHAEEQLNPSSKKHRAVEQIHRLRRGMVFVRRSVWPLREVISRVLRQDASHFSKATLFYLRDVYDHTIQVVDTIEMFRDLVQGMLDLYRSGMTQRLNEIMKILTIVSTIFCPLTFITGMFGMNFQNMPELHWRYGYPAAVGLMVAVALFMLGYFKHKKWL